MHAVAQHTVTARVVAPTNARASLRKSSAKIARPMAAAPLRRSIVTARPEEAEGFSKQQIGAMVSGGSPAHMYHMPDQYLRQRKVECYKRNCRRQIEQDGDILLNIGDQWSDVLGTKRVLNNALDLEEEGHLSTVKAYVIVAKSDEGRSYLASRAGIKLPG